MLPLYYSNELFCFEIKIRVVKIAVIFYGQISTYTQTTESNSISVLHYLSTVLNNPRPSV